METSVSPENQDGAVPMSSLTSCHKHKPGNEASTGPCLQHIPGLWQSLSCPSPPSEICLSPQHKHKRFCRARAVKCTVEPCFSYSHFFVLQVVSCPGFQAVPGVRDAADESQRVSEREDLLHAKHQLKS